MSEVWPGRYCLEDTVWKILPGAGRQTLWNFGTLLSLSFKTLILEILIFVSIILGIL